MNECYRRYIADESYPSPTQMKIDWHLLLEVGAGARSQYCKHGRLSRNPRRAVVKVVTQLRSFATIRHDSSHTVSQSVVIREDCSTFGNPRRRTVLTCCWASFKQKPKTHLFGRFFLNLAQWIVWHKSAENNYLLVYLPYYPVIP